MQYAKEMHNKQFHARIWVWLSLFFVATTIFAQVPPRPEPPRLVNDMASLFTPEQTAELEQLLVTFNDSTSNQIVVLTVPDLGGLEPSDFAFQVGQQWGVGQKDKNNGIVILIKPKNESKGRVFIAPGYGLEGVLPDALCRRIEEQNMIPYFKQNDYFGGVVSAMSVILPAAKGEYNEAMAKKDEGISFMGALLLLGVIIFIVLVLFGRNKNNGNFNGRGGGGRGPSGGDILTLLLLGGLSGRSHGGSWGDFSGGGGSSRGGGDFGGFGGGGFGGGGAGGSW
jgi:uncharacterized protein